MTTISMVRPLARPAMRPLARLGASVARAWRAFEHVQEVWVARRRIQDLDDRMLRDLGITRSQALYEASRPIWDRRMPFGE